MIFFFCPSLHNTTNKTQTATNSHLGSLKAKVAKLKREIEGVKGSGGGGGEGFDVRASGNGEYPE